MSAEAANTQVLRISPTAVVCQEATLVGDITIGDGCIVHPKACILAEGGPIVIGTNNIIEEQVTIKNSVEAQEADKVKVITIGNNNIFEVAAHVEALLIGNDNVIECKAHLGPGTVIGNGCVIGSTQIVSSKDNIVDNTVLFGNPSQAVVQPKVHESHLAMHSKHLEILTKQLPNFHHLKKSTAG